MTFLKQKTAASSSSPPSSRAELEVLGSAPPLRAAASLRPSKEPSGDRVRRSSYGTAALPAGISEMPVVWSTGPPASRPFPAVLGWTVTRGRRTPRWPRAPLADKPSSWSQSEAQKPAQPRESGVQPPGPGGVGGVPSPSWLPLDEAPLTPSRASSTCPGLGFESFQTHLPSPAGHPESPKHALAGALGPTKSAFCPLSVRIAPAL